MSLFVPTPQLLGLHTGPGIATTLLSLLLPLASDPFTLVPALKEAGHFLAQCEPQLFPQAPTEPIKATIHNCLPK